jgi:hypothetical protein
VNDHTVAEKTGSVLFSPSTDLLLRALSGAAFLAGAIAKKF